MPLVRVSNGGKFLEPRHYVFFSASTSTTDWGTGIYTSGTAFSIKNVNNGFGRTALIGVKGISGTLGASFSPNQFARVLGMKNEEVTQLYVTSSTKASFTVNFSDFDLLIIDTGAGNPSTSCTLKITES